MMTETHHAKPRTSITISATAPVLPPSWMAHRHRCMVARVGGGVVDPHGGRQSSTYVHAHDQAQSHSSRQQVPPRTSVA